MVTIIITIIPFPEILWGILNYDYFFNDQKLELFSISPLRDRHPKILSKDIWTDYTGYKIDRDK